MKKLFSKVQRKDSAKAIAGIMNANANADANADANSNANVNANANANHARPTVKEAFENSIQSVDESRKGFERSKMEIYEKESTGAWDRQARLSASDAEMKAATIIWKIREDERDNLFGNKASEAIPGPDTLDMGGQFLTNKKRIDTRSRLFKIAKQMPKGCHLHLHFNAELECRELIKKARELPNNMFIRSTQPMLSQKDYDETELVFNVMPANTPTADIFSPAYNPAWKTPDARPWMRWTDFGKELSKRLPNIDPEEWIRDKMVLSEEEVYNGRQTVNGYVSYQIRKFLQQSSDYFTGFGHDLIKPHVVLKVC